MSISISRLSAAWFEFKGVKSNTLDVYMTKMPARHIPARNLVRTKVAARSGSVRMTDGSYDDIAIDVSFMLLNPANRNTLAALLTGSGKLRFSDDDTYEYDAVIETSPSMQFVHNGFDPQEYDVTFICHPFKTLHTPASDIVATEGGVYTNPGTAESLPRVTVVGSGAFNITIDGVTMFFHDVVDGVIIDSELGDVLNAAGTLLANANAEGELYRIKPGNFLVDWTEGGIGVDANDDDVTLPGTITSVTITPRWGYG